MKLAIVGSRTFNDYSLLLEAIENTISNETIDLIISGGAEGADKLAEKYAKENNIPLQIFKPDWKKYGKAAGPIRNELIIQNADLVIAFWDGESKGIQSSINLARKHNKECKIIYF